LNGTTPLKQPNPKVWSSNLIDGRRTVAGYTKRRLPLEQEFAMDKSSSSGFLPFEPYLADQDAP
jgi:hypothetical protein